MSIDLHNALKTALRLENQTLTDFAGTITKPDGSIGISYSFLIRVAQGREHTEYILKAIHNKVAESQARYPQYYKVQMKANRRYKDAINA
jgi:hypothetical protein